MLKMYFLNVGKGNCVIVDFPSDRLTVVDIDNSKINDDNDVLQDPIVFLNNKYPNSSIFRFILTHPDMDHMSGLDELNRKRTITNFWDTDNDKEIDSNSFNSSNYDKKDWETYQKLRASKSNPTVLFNHQETEPSSYWQEDKIKILGPSKSMIDLAKETEEYNHCSYVLKIEHEGIKIILGGDATKESWKDILDFHGKNELKADVFLAPHHGSPSNINEEVFQHINPDYVIVSDDRGHSYDYQYYNSLAKKQVYSTKHFGNITLEISADKKTITPEKNG